MQSPPTSFELAVTGVVVLPVLLGVLRRVAVVVTRPDGGLRLCRDARLVRAGRRFLGAGPSTSGAPPSSIGPSAASVDGEPPSSTAVSKTDFTAAGFPSSRGVTPVSPQVPSGEATKVSSRRAWKPVVGGSSPRTFLYVSIVASATCAVARPRSPRPRPRRPRCRRRARLVELGEPRLVRPRAHPLTHDPENEGAPDPTEADPGAA